MLAAGPRVRRRAVLPQCVIPVRMIRFARLGGALVGEKHPTIERWNDLTLRLFGRIGIGASE